MRSIFTMRSITELKSLNYTSIGLIEDFISLRYDLKGFYFLENYLLKVAFENYMKSFLVYIL